MYELIENIKNDGVVGAGGAGFPSYAKIDKRANIILMNCAECEPLLNLHKMLLEEYPLEILKAFNMIADRVNANEAIIGIKAEYKSTILSIKKHIHKFPKIKLHLLDNVYPMGDEVVLIYEATGIVIPPGGLPIESGVVVFNVETIYNIHKSMEEKKPVTDKLVSILGEVSNPITIRVPIGTSVEDAVAQSGEVTIENPVFFLGGPMMGYIGRSSQPITKTTNAIIVLPEDHLIVRMYATNASIGLKRAASICCQCRMCTDLCPRNAIGHPIEPHKFMQSASNKDFQDINVFTNTLFCSSCGICEMYACPQSLSPRSLIAEYKDGLRKLGVKPEKNIIPKEIEVSREYRKVPEERLQSRLGISKYDVNTIFVDDTANINQVTILMSQHIGSPAQPIVAIGDAVEIGQIIGKPAEGLSVAIHASIAGEVTEVNSSHIKIRGVMPT